MQLHFLQERKEALERAKSSPLGDAFNLLVSLIFLANTVVNSIVAYVEHGNTIRSSDITLLFGYHADPVATTPAIIVLTVFLICEVGKEQNITGWEPITSIPMSLLLTYGAVLLLSWFSFQGNQYSVFGPMTLSVLLVSFIASNNKRHKRERLRAQKALRAKSQPETWAGPTKIEHCEVCHKESQYDLCLECYKKYRGERQRVKAQLLRAKQAGVAATLTLGEWIETLDTFHWHCAYCHGSFECLEHYVPVVEGGGTTQDNCVPSCHSCNSTKSVKHPEK